MITTIATIMDSIFVFDFFCQKNFLGDLFAEKETKRRPILAKGLLRRPRSPKGDLIGNTVMDMFFNVTKICNFEKF